MMDWNWFYSSIAQSAAAIVGIFAAFIITKIVNNQSEYKRKLSKIYKIFNDSTKLIERAQNLHFKWYNDNIRGGQLSELEDLIKESDGKKPPEEYYNQLDFSIFDAKKEVIKYIELAIWKYNDSKIKKDYKPWITKDLFQNVINWVEVNKEGERIRQCLIDINHHSRDVSIFAHEVSRNPESSRLITISIIGTVIIFYIGVIFPLLFLPINTNQTENLSVLHSISCLFSWTPKGIMLISVSIVFTAILSLFLFINLRLKINITTADNLMKYTRLATYSEFFAEIEPNLSGEGPIYRIRK